MGPSSDDDHQPLGLSSTRPQLLLSVATHAESPPHVHPSIPQIRSLHRGGLMRLLVWHRTQCHTVRGQSTTSRPQSYGTENNSPRDEHDEEEQKRQFLNSRSFVFRPFACLFIWSSVKASRLDLYVVSTRVMTRQGKISHQTRIVCARWRVQEICTIMNSDTVNALIYG